MINSFIAAFVGSVSGIGTMTWSPLACGILTGKYDDGVPIYSRAALKVIKTSKPEQVLVNTEQIFISPLLHYMSVGWCI